MERQVCKTSKIRWYVGLFSLIVVSALAGCGSSSDQGAATSGTATSGGSEAKGQPISVAIEPLAPYTYKENGKWTGIDTEIMEEVAKRLGRPLAYKEMLFPAMLASVQSGRVDMAIGEVGWTPDRTKTGLFSDPPYYVPALWATRHGVTANNVEELKGLTLGTGVNNEWIPALNDIPDAKVKLYQDPPSLLAALDTGRVDVAFMGPAELLTIKKERPELKFTVVSPPPVTDAEVAEHPAWMSFRRKMTGFYIDPKQKDLEQAVSGELQKLYKEGTFLDSVAKKYGMSSDDLFVSEPYMTPQRIAVDRPKGWVAPTQ